MDVDRKIDKYSGLFQSIRTHHINSEFVKYCYPGEVHTLKDGGRVLHIHSNTEPKVSEIDTRETQAVFLDLVGNVIPCNPLEDENGENGYFVKVVSPNRRKVAKFWGGE